MSLLFTLAAFAVTLGVLIVVHEYGHYLAARACGVKVLRFSVGFGRPLVAHRFHPDGTEWVIAAFPLGGYVKMLDEREAPVPPEERDRAFNTRPVGCRMFIVAAGPLANFLLAVVIYWGLFLHGLPGMRPVLDAPPAGSAAALAGLARGDTLVRVAGQAIRTWEEVSLALVPHLGRDEAVEIEAVDSLTRQRVVLLSTRSMGSDAEEDFLARLGLVPLRAIEPRVGEVLPASPAAEAGLTPGDWIVAVDGVSVSDWKTLVEAVRPKAGKAVRLSLTRQGRVHDVVVVPRAEVVAGQTIGRIGVAPWAFVTVREEGMAAGAAALSKTAATARLSLELLAKMIMGEVSLRNLSGPVAIADYAGQSARLGWLPFLSFLALVSVSLGVLNLLPVPVLDGGHLMYHLAELLTGRPVSERALMLGQRVGMVILFGLMLLALYNDIYRLLGL